MKMCRNPEMVHPPIAGYSHQIEVSGPQRWLLLSGQIGRRADGEVPDDPIEQLAVALENLRGNLGAAAMDVTDVVKLTVYLVGEIDTGRRRDVLGAWLAGHETAMTVVYVSALAAPMYRVEIDAWACRDDGGGDEGPRRQR